MVVQPLSSARHLTALRISGGRTRERTRVDDRPLQPLEGWRKAPDRKRVVIRNADGAAMRERRLEPVGGLYLVGTFRRAVSTEGRSNRPPRMTCRI